MRLSIDIKVLTDLKRFCRRNLLATLRGKPLLAHGPKEGRPLQLEPLPRTQTALILFSLLQTTEKKRATGIKPMVRFARRRGCKPRLPVGPSLQVRKDLHVYSSPAREGC